MCMKLNGKGWRQSPLRCCTGVRERRGNLTAAELPPEKLASGSPAHIGHMSNQVRVYDKSGKSCASMRRLSRLQSSAYLLQRQQLAA